MIFRFLLWAAAGVIIAFALSYAVSHAEVICDIAPNAVAIDAEEAELLRLINQHRGMNGLPLVSLSPTLNKAAAWFAADMARYNYLSHETQQGDDIDVRLLACGYDRAIYTWRGEVALGGSNTAANAFEVFWHSPGHQATMLDDKYVAVGIARAWNAIDVSYWWVADFTSYLDAPMMTGPTPSPTVTLVSTVTRTPNPTWTPRPSATPTATVIPSATRTPEPTVQGMLPTATSVPVMVTSVVASGDRLANGDFARGLDGWERPSWYASQISVQQEQLVVSGRTSGPYVQQFVPAMAGETVTLSGSIAVPVAGRGMNGAVELVVRNAYNGTLSTIVVQPITASASPNWGRFVETVTLPSGAAVVGVRVRFTSLDGTVLLDDLSLG